MLAILNWQEFCQETQNIKTKGGIKNMSYPTATIKTRPPKQEKELCSNREMLKQKIDSMSEEEIRLLSYRLRLNEIEKEITKIEREVQEYNSKRSSDK